MTTGYSGKPLVAKLGISSGCRVLLDGPPEGFELGEVAAGVVVDRRARGAQYDVGLLFCPDLGRLTTRWPVLHDNVTPEGRLWVAWPKRASGIVTDVDENLVRAHGLAYGRVDTKVCAIDAIWSGLAFVVRLKDR